MHGLVRCKHECRCSRARGEDASFTDVKIKPQIGNWTRECEWRHALEAWAKDFGDLRKKQWVEFLPLNEGVEIQSWVRPDEFVRYGRRVLVGLRADDPKTVSDSYVCLWTFYEHYVYLTHLYIMGMLQWQCALIAWLSLVDFDYL